MSMPSLLLGSENRGKLVEIQSILAGLEVKLVLPGDVGLHLDVDESGQTYAENAALKAQAYQRASRLVTLADDSGLEVAALDGAPGIHSHRFSPLPQASDADRRAYLLQLLQGKPRPWRARFYCAVAVAVLSGQVYSFDGECQGEIIPEERGQDGFGYDPIFYIPEYGATMAELGRGVKNQISHRARAVRAAQPMLQKIFNLT
jgi:XTP/dITP diphosphohydrolase